MAVTSENGVSLMRFPIWVTFLSRKIQLSRWGSLNSISYETSALGTCLWAHRYPRRSSHLPYIFEVFKGLDLGRSYISMICRITIFVKRWDITRKRLGFWWSRDYEKKKPSVRAPKAFLCRDSKRASTAASFRLVEEEDHPCRGHPSCRDPFRGPWSPCALPSAPCDQPKPPTYPRCSASVPSQWDR